MDKILYYPYINLPRTDWTLRTLLYYDNIGSIVPQEYRYEPKDSYEPFMYDLIKLNLVTEVNPLDVLDDPWGSTRPFLDLINRNQAKLRAAQSNFRAGRRERIHEGKFNGARIHTDKFHHGIFYGLEQMGLAEMGKRNWYHVEARTADNLMKFLATLISAKTDRLPTTDYIKPSFRRAAFIEQKKRETILAGLIPFPEEIDLKKILRFKEKHYNLLLAFRARVEKIVLDPNITEGSPLFDVNLQELLHRKQELSDKMNESRLGGIIFGTVFGLIGGAQGLATASTPGAIVGSLPGFANAIYSALKIEKAENIFDQSGLKYLALADKRIRNNLT